MEDLLGKFFILLSVSAGVMLIIGTIVIVVASWNGYQEIRRCAKWEKKIVHQEAYTQWIYSGNTMIPINHPARNVEMDVCVQSRK